MVQAAAHHRNRIRRRGLQSARIDPAHDHVHALHALSPGDSTREQHPALNRSTREAGPGVKSPHLQLIVQLGLVRVRQAVVDRQAVGRIHRVHQGKSSKVSRRGRRRAGPNVQIRLRRPQSQNVPQYPDQTVFKIKDLRGILDAKAVQDYERMGKSRVCTEVVRTPINGIVQAIRRASRAQKRLGDLPVHVVDDSQWRLHRAWLNVGWKAQDPPRDRHVGAVYILG